MSYLICLAIFYGMVIALGRTINGQLSKSVGALFASFWNHLVGFLFLSLLVVVMQRTQLMQIPFNTIPTSAWLGGVWGAIFVLLSSYVFPKLGAMKTSMLIIAGQIISAVLWDIATQNGEIHWIRIIGVALIAFGIYLSAKQTNK